MDGSLWPEAGHLQNPPPCRVLRCGLTKKRLWQSAEAPSARAFLGWRGASCLSGDHHAAARTHFTRGMSDDMRRCYTLRSKHSTDFDNWEARSVQRIAVRLM